MAAKYAIMGIDPAAKNLSIRGWVPDTFMLHCPTRMGMKTASERSLLKEADPGSERRSFKAIFHANEC